MGLKAVSWRTVTTAGGIIPNLDDLPAGVKRNQLPLGARFHTSYSKNRKEPEQFSGSFLLAKSTVRVSRGLDESPEKAFNEK
ncbi:hypothetical protein LSP04_02370 [Levilactobacillus spicheri]|uniref:Uncharacterized protein n=1 Tax=Levilactobacillus spicheri TaxID=216463 RepID=A0ABQ0WLH3_9LACO|nr:hypothetical protein LSP04_02370 [Levilactobacillus spicheri]